MLVLERGFGCLWRWRRFASVSSSFHLIPYSSFVSLYNQLLMVEEEAARRNALNVAEEYIRSDSGVAEDQTCIPL